MLIYHYTRDYLIFLGSEEGTDSPLEPGVTLVPSYATLIVPPAINANEAAVFDEDTDTWSVQPNFIGQVGYDKVTRDRVVITDLGVFPSNVTLEVPQTELDEWNATSSLWETSLVESQKDSKFKIDGTAEAARLRYITRGAGQAMIYQEKASQSEAFILAGYPADLTGYSLIQAEVNATGKTATQAADDIIVQRDSWLTLGAQIEEIRLAGKIAVDAAVDVAGVTSTQNNTMALLDAI